MSTVYLHIGTVKTGTSAIQSFLANNRKVLEQKGYCLPELDFNFGMPFVHRNGHFLVHRFHRETPEKSRAEFRAVQDRAFAILEEKAKEYDHIILTDEGIWQYCWARKDFWKNLRMRMEQINCHVKIIVYLRRQDLLVESLWNQRVKSFYRTTRAFDQWMRAKRYASYPLDYYVYLNKIAKDMGKENILLRVYEKSAFMAEGKSIFSDFLETINLTLTEEYSVENISSNSGLRGNFVELKRRINEIPEYRKMEDFLRRPILHASNHVNDIDPAPDTTLFTDKRREAFMKQFEESNRRVAEEYLGRDDGILFSEAYPELPAWELNEKQVDRDLLVIMGEVFCAQEHTLIQQRDSIRRLENSMRSVQERMNAQQNKIRALEADVTSMYKSPMFRAYWKIRKALKGQ